MFSLTFLTVALLAVAQLCGVSAAPASPLDSKARQILSRAKQVTPAAPHWVGYADANTGNGPAPDASALAGYNVFILSFYLDNGPSDDLALWTRLSSAQRSSIKTQYANAGIKLMVSAFGSTESPTTAGVDPISMANKLGDFVIQFGFDGIDIDYEDFSAFTSSGRAEPWLVSLTTQLRTKLPVGQFILTHAPVAPWFSPNLWQGGGYLQINSQVGDLIDWYNIQFYSQGPNEYVNCNGLLHKSSSQFPKSSIFEIAASGVPQEKLVLGKIATPSEASDFMDPGLLATCIQEAKNEGWTAGSMVWQFSEGGSQWMTTIRSLSWPV